MTSESRAARTSASHPIHTTDSLHDDPEASAQIQEDPAHGGGPTEPVRIVAIGASAGGLEPIEQLFDAMPTDSGLAFVIIQHLSPDFRSMMDQLLARHSTMAIHHPEDGTRVEPNVVYLNPPRKELTIANGRLHLRERADPEVLSFPIDGFMHSLAEDRKEAAIGIILSGTGSDGTLGASAICQAGGVVIVQEPSSAKFDAMPRSALERGVATVTALPRDMAALIERHIGGETLGMPDPGESFQSPEHEILALLQKRYGADFGYYKHATVNRRIRRRALMNQVSDPYEYARFVRENTDELEALYCDLLIGVTAFFRDKQAFDALASQVIPDIASRMAHDRQLRIWVAGCASGEEPYSIAILVSEFARKNGLPLNLKIFATDIHFTSLDIASAGLYAEESLQGVRQDLIDEYFEKAGDKFQVKQHLRRLVVFSPHNLIKDPPFTRMDLVSCRNLLIYLDDVAQKKVLALFHFALEKDGVLFLGPSETTGELESEFETLDQKWRIFRKQRDIRLRESTKLLPLSPRQMGAEEEVGRLRERRLDAGFAADRQVNNLQRQTVLHAYDRVLEAHAPPSLLVARDGTLVHVFGDADRFLQVGSGIFSPRVTEILHHDLKLAVSAGLERARGQHAAPYVRDVLVARADEAPVPVTVGIEKLAADGIHADFMLVTLGEREQAGPQIVPEPEAAEETGEREFLAQRVRDLERDLRLTEESLQSTIEELETSNEELQATNEELMASNEELQSTNEELHSVNEELYTVSAEHQRKIEELTEITDDMDNLLRSSDIGTIFLDIDLKIRRFTPAAARTFNLLAHDLGRPIQHVTFRFEDEALIGDIERVRAGGDPVDKEVDVDGHAFLLRVLPYRSDQSEAAGVVLTIVDVHALKQAQRQLTQQQKLYETVVQHQTELVHRFKPDTTLTFVNAAYCRHYGKPAEDLLGQRFIELLPKSERAVTLASLAELRPGEDSDYQRQDIRHDGACVWLQWRRHAIAGPDGTIDEIQSVGHDITELKQVQEQLAAEEARFRNLYRMAPVMMFSMDRDGRLVEASAYWLKVMGYREEDVIGRNAIEFMAADFRSVAVEEVLPQIWERGLCMDVPCQMIKKNGAVIDVRFSAILDEAQSGEKQQSHAAMIDVTNQLSAERALEAQNEDLARINDNLQQFTHIVSHDLTAPLRAVRHTADWIVEDLGEAERDKVREHTRRLKGQVDQLDSMLSDLLEYSRAGHSDRSAQPIDLPEIVERIAKMVETEKELSLDVDCEIDDMVTLKAPLELIFRNLVENAVKYHDRAQANIQVRAHDAIDHWVFEVQDDGPGIDPKFHDKIFLPFRKLERKDRARGNGMGLALVKKAVETNGGKIEIVSDPAARSGTTFRFTWPKLRPMAAVAAA